MLSAESTIRLCKGTVAKETQANEAENVLEIWRRTIGKQMAKVDKTFNELR